jgi:2-polyprenyl-6-methoxyphenol hydroxylase-like FAD-dependent oxidoreductase
LRANDTALHIGIIGAGTAGSAAAIVLSRQGHDVTVFERVTEPGPVGAGLLMQPSGLAVLTALGLDAPIRARGARVERLRCVRRDGRVIFELPYGNLAPGLHGVGLHRGVLFSTLFGAAAACARIITGHNAVRLHSHGRQKVIVCDNGDAHGPYDLVVVAGGARSTVIDEEPAIRRAVPYPWGALWFVAQVERPRDELFQVLHGTRAMFGVLPAGVGPNGNTPLVTVFWSIPASQHDRVRDDGLGKLKARLSRHSRDAEPLVHQLTDMSQVLFAAYMDVRMPRWDVGPVVYVGDAGHAMSPQLGQGANIALNDAFVLGECLRDESDVVSALAAYSRRRRWTLGYYQLATRWLTPFFQSDYAFLGVMRDYAMPITTRLPLLRTVMLRSMTGLF